MSALRPESPQTVFYSLDTEPAEPSCSQSISGSLRVWEFTTSSPFNRTGMAVLDSHGKIVFSRASQWADLPGVMVAEVLQRDLSQSDLFTLVFLGTPSLDAAFELSGRVHEFCCRQSGEESRAVLKVAVSLLPTKLQPDLVMHKTYTLESPPFASNEPSQFAQAMSSLVSQLSLRVQNDLCRVAASWDRQ
jgi:ABC-type uncharacterized transport system auxiliary subunit